MNVGQILETVLGFAGGRLVKNLQEFVRNNGYQEVKEPFKRYIMVQNLLHAYEKEDGKEGIQSLHKTAEDGVYFKTPVFDGADFEEDIKPFLKSLNCQYRNI